MQREVDAGDLADRDRHVRLDCLAESSHRHLHIVGAGQNVRQAICALLVRNRFPDEARFLVGDRQGCPRDYGALCVLDVPDDTAVKDLRLHRRGTEDHARYREAHDRQT